MKTIETSDTIFTTPFIPRPFAQKLQQKEFFLALGQQTKTWLNLVCIDLLVIKLCGLTHGKDTHRMFKREM
jgi:hypothetical protein